MTITITAKIQYEPGEAELSPAQLAKQFTSAARAILRNRARIEAEATRAIAATGLPKVRRACRNRSTELVLPIDALEKSKEANA